MARLFICTTLFILALVAPTSPAWPEENTPETTPMVEPAPLENRSITAEPEQAAQPAQPTAEERFGEALKTYKSGDYDEAAHMALETAGIFPGTPWEGRAVFLAGRAYAAKGDIDASPKVLGAALQKYPVLADYSLYLLGGLYYKQSRLEDAAMTYSSLAADYPGSLLVPDSLLKAGDCYLKLGLLPDAIAALKRFIDIKGASSVTAEARYMLMKAYIGLDNKDAAYAQYRTLWLDYPYNANTTKAGELMDGLVEAGYEMPAPTLEDALKRASRLYDEGHYKTASAEYEKAYGLLPEGDRRSGEVLLKDGICNYRLRENDRAVYFFRKAAEGPSRYAPEALYWLVKTYLRTGDDGRLRDAAIRCATEYPDDEKAAESLYMLGVNCSTGGDYYGAAEVFNTILDSCPEWGRTDEVAWQLGWAYYQAGEYKAADDALKGLASDYPDSELAPQAYYWRGKALEALGRPDEAAGCFEKVAGGYPMSFYASLAAGREGQASGAAPEAAVPTPVPGTSKSYSDPAFVRAAELGLQGMEADGVRELRPAERRYCNRMEDVRNISGLYYSLGEYQRPLELASGLYARDLKTGRGRIPGDALGLLYPLAFWDDVRSQSEASGVDPMLVYSIIREESRFDTDTVSPAGAVGLMQLMPGTAMTMCRRLNIKYASSEQLKEGSFNIPLGICYLKSLMEKHGGRLVRVLAEYNAGPGPLGRWIDKSPDSSDDAFIEKITYYETRGYVKRVLRNYYIYRKLYGTGIK